MHWELIMVVPPIMITIIDKIIYASTVKITILNCNLNTNLYVKFERLDVKNTVGPKVRSKCPPYVNMARCD